MNVCTFVQFIYKRINGIEGIVMTMMMMRNPLKIIDSYIIDNDDDSLMNINDGEPVLQLR